MRLWYQYIVGKMAHNWFGKCQAKVTWMQPQFQGKFPFRQDLTFLPVIDRAQIQAEEDAAIFQAISFAVEHRFQWNTRKAKYPPMRTIKT